MPARVSPQLGRLGPINDVAAMATNVAAVWNGDRLAMGHRARAHATAIFPREICSEIERCCVVNSDATVVISAAREF